MVSEAEMSMTLFVWGRHGGFHKQPPVCTSPRGARQGKCGTTGPGRGLAMGAVQPARGSHEAAGSPAPHLSLLHRWAPLVMVKPPVSSCWTCMARRRAEGSVGCARKRRPSIRHRLSLFRKTWGPSRGCGQGETGERSVWGALLRQPRSARGRPLREATALMYIPSTLYLGGWGLGWTSGRLKLADTKGTWTPMRKPHTSRHQKWQTCFLTYSLWAPENSRVTQLPQGGRDPGCPT